MIVLFTNQSAQLPSYHNWVTYHTDHHTTSSLTSFRERCAHCCRQHSLPTSPAHATGVRASDLLRDRVGHQWEIGTYSACNPGRPWLTSTKDNSQRTRGQGRGTVETQISDGFFTFTRTPVLCDDNAAERTVSLLQRISATAVFCMLCNAPQKGCSAPG